MTYLDVANIIAQMGLPYAWDHFKEGDTNPDGTAIAPPFICYWLEDRDFHADNINYVGMAMVYIELYTWNKDIIQEKNVEKVLKDNGLSYRKYSAYIDDEKMWQIAYHTEVYIDG